MQINEQFMERAIELAKKGRGNVRPNPMVGAVIVKAGRIIGEGYHEKFGELHAERKAILSCSEATNAADLYVTLEPCCHYGKTPPCTKAIIEAGIKRVFVGSDDPNPEVSGKGILELQNSGIEVIKNVLKQDCDRLNEVFFHFISKKRPFVILKYAMTLDGKIATTEGDSKWISGEEARKEVHRRRGLAGGIMVGIGTALQDNPMLNCRLNACKEGENQPLRIICDSHLRLPLSSQLVKTARDYPTLIAAVSGEAEKEKALQAAGISILYTPSGDGQVNLLYLLLALGEKGIDSLIVEGGGNLNFTMLKLGLVNRVEAYIAPKILGGEAAKTPVEGLGFGKIGEGVRLLKREISILGDDLLLEMDVVKEAD